MQITNKRSVDVGRQSIYRIYRFIFILYIIMSLSLPLFGQNSAENESVYMLSVDQAVAIALEYNTTLKLAQIDLQSQERSKNTNWNNFVPSLTLGSGISRNNGNSGLFPSAPPLEEKKRWGMDISINASWTLSQAAFSTFQKNIRDYENGLDTYQNAVNKLERDVKKAFYDILLKTEEIRVSQFSLQNAEKKYMQDKTNYNKGLVSEMVLLRSQLSYETAKTDMASKVFSRDTALDSFRALLGLPQGDVVQMMGDLTIVPALFNAQELIDLYLYNRTDVKTQLRTLEELKIAKTEAYISTYAPTFSATYGMNLDGLLSPDTFDAAKNIRDTGALSLRLSIPLDSFIPGTKTNNIFYNRQVQIEKATLMFNQTIETATNDIWNAVSILNRSINTLENLVLNEKIAQRSYDLTYAAYQRGETDYQSVQDAQVSLESAKQRILSELFSYRSRVLDLEYILNAQLQDK